MKKIIALLLLLPVQVYAVSDCANKPTCEEIGYSHNEYACDQKLTTPCAFDSSKVYCPGPVCEPGYFLYSDGSCSLSLKSDKTVIGIVFDKEWRLAVSVEPAQSLKWDEQDTNGTVIVPDLGYGVTYSNSTCTSECSGRENTKKIIDYGKEINHAFPAAEHCYNLSVEGKGKGNWWLPSISEIYKLYSQLSLVDAALLKAGATEINKYSHWTAQQFILVENGNTTSTAARYFNPGIGSASHYGKTAPLWVRCVTRY